MGEIKSSKTQKEVFSIAKTNAQKLQSKLAGLSVCTGGISWHVKVKGFAKICGVGERDLCQPGYCQTREKKERKSQWSYGKPPKPPLHQILPLCCQPFLFCVTRIATFVRSDRLWRLSCTLKKEAYSVVEKISFETLELNLVTMFSALENQIFSLSLSEVSGSKIMNFHRQKHENYNNWRNFQYL